MKAPKLPPQPRRRRNHLSSALIGVAGLVFVASAVYAQPSGEVENASANGAGALLTFPNSKGQSGIYLAEGNVDLANNAFFAPIGANGRSCATCHHLSDGMSLSANTAERIWEQTGGKDPLFAAVDGSNCPNLPQGEKSSHSLLLERGLFRIPMAWPPKRLDGTEIEPQFTIEVVRDPTTCNLDPQYGLNSANPRISVYRRPRMAANLKYPLAGAGGPRFGPKNGEAAPRDPETGLQGTEQLMWDGRQLTLGNQAMDAMAGHMESRLAPAVPPVDHTSSAVVDHSNGARGPTRAQLEEIIAFESQVYAAQVYHNVGGDLTESGGPEALGPLQLFNSRPGLLANNHPNPVWKSFEMWKNAQATDPQSQFRASVARGNDIFMLRPFMIKDAMHMNTLGMGNPIKRTCATCHSTQMTGMNSVGAGVDVGSTNLPWAVDSPDLPLFKLTCKPEFRRDFHPFLGPVVYTQDPGRALVTGRCNDIGSMVQSQFRALAARPPYFSNGSAKTLEDVVNFYDRRFNMAMTAREREDLVNFLSVL